MSGKSSEEVAFDLVAKLKGMGVWGEKNMSDILDMYAECLDAVKGTREYVPGQCLIEPHLRPKPATPTQAPHMQQNVAPQQQQPTQHAPQAQAYQPIMQAR